jgi:hypothetical protein
MSKKPFLNPIIALKATIKELRKELKQSKRSYLRLNAKYKKNLERRYTYRY